ncbi:MAG: hypothetical protein HS101_13970 [Planctomycetia bacterium]|jgi:hypothetical protein|nr:hypothetical protein [Planctomycetia bacterium]MCC7314666.1 hypothetical protein [Planctomycetota bacterium]OQZ06297.1 MAG: hypothetical protein B6D36_05715 [Planctomycetes bacterium UTPLA1]
MKRQAKDNRSALRRVRLLRRARLAMIAIAALPMFQATGCFPDPIGALNFELQNLVNFTLIDWVNTIVQNVFRL